MNIPRLYSIRGYPGFNRLSVHVYEDFNIIRLGKNGTEKCPQASA